MRIDIYFIFIFVLLISFSFILKISIIFIILFSNSLLLLFFLINKYAQFNSNNRTAILDLISALSTNKQISGAEVGVYEGYYSNIMINRFKKNKIYLKKLYLIDPWIINQNYKHSNREFLIENLYMQKAYNKVINTFNKNNRIEILKLSSFDAALKIDNSTLDFVYIDADHSYESVSQDLEIWFDKLKPNGILFGDDYFSKSPIPYGVAKAVNEFAFKKKLICHFTDNFKQFFFIKNNIN